MEAMEQNIRRQQTESCGFQTVGSAAVCAVRTVLERRGFKETALLSRWPAIVGHETAMVCLPTKLAFHHRKQYNDGTLYLLVAGGSFAIDLQHRSAQLIGQINAYFGYALVGQIRLIQGLFLSRPYPSQFLGLVAVLPLDKGAVTLAAELAPIKDDALREALNGLGQAILYPFCQA